MNKHQELLSDYTWPCLVGTEEQYWLQRGDRFVEVTSGEISYPVDADLDALRPNRCTDSNQLLPGGFRYSPFTGAPAKSVLSSSQAVPVAAPFGGLDGLPELTEFNLPQLAEDPEEVRLPVGGPFELAVAGQPERLLAIDWRHGRLYRWSLTRGAWSTPIEIGHSTAAVGVWASTIAARHIAFPAEDGLTIVDPGGMGSPEVVRRIPGAGGIPPAALDGKFHWPCVRDDQPVLISVDTDDLEAEQVVGLEIGPNAGLPRFSALADEPGIGFAAPAVDALGYIYWVSGAGYIRAEPPGKVAWVPTVSDLCLYPRFRPCRNRGLLYQLGFGETERRYCHYRLCPEIVQAEIKFLDGWHLSAGATTFRSNRRYRSPWINSRVEHWVESGQFIQPFLAFANETVVYGLVEGRTTADRFFAGETRRAELIVSYSPNQSRVLGSFETGMWNGLRIVPFGDALWAMDQSAGRVLRWAFARETKP